MFFIVKISILGDERRGIDVSAKMGTQTDILVGFWQEAWPKYGFSYEMEDQRKGNKRKCWYSWFNFFFGKPENKVSEKGRRQMGNNKTELENRLSFIVNCVRENKEIKVLFSF